VPSPSAEGRWTLAVTATDDQGLASAASRRFAVNSTIGFLRVTPARVVVRPSGGNASIRWTQTRAARVKVTVETPQGVVVRTVANGSLPPGEQTSTWDGLGARRKPVAGGAYVVKVTATNELGAVSLGQPITVRRVK
jgi:flagellar hook assembly protein FlgD